MTWNRYPVNCGVFGKDRKETAIALFCMYCAPDFALIGTRVLAFVGISRVPVFLHIFFKPVEEDARHS